MSECHVPRLLRDKRIAIVGAGPAGLTLARLLQRQGATVAVFERDASVEARDQGGSLDLHEDAGQRALELTGLDAVFQAVARPEGQLSRILDAQGRLLVELRAEDEARSRPEVDRMLLRHMLLASLDPGTVRWGHRLAGVEATTAEQWRLRFTSGESAEVDLLFGCDGLWSPVRRLRSDAAPAYTGVTFVQAFINDIKERHPDLDRIAGPGSAMALGDNKAIMAQRNGDGRLRLYLALRVPEAWAETGGLPWSHAEAVRRRLLALFADWAPTCWR